MQTTHSTDRDPRLVDYETDLDRRRRQLPLEFGDDSTRC